MNDHVFDYVNLIVGLVLGLFGAVIGGVIWFVRLEGKVQRNTEVLDETKERVGEHDLKIEHLESKIVTELSKIKESVAEIKGYLLKRKETKDDQE